MSGWGSCYEACRQQNRTVCAPLHAPTVTMLEYSTHGTCNRRRNVPSSDRCVGDFNSIFFSTAALSGGNDGLWIAVIPGGGDPRGSRRVPGEGSEDRREPVERKLPAEPSLNTRLPLRGRREFTRGVGRFATPEAGLACGANGTPPCSPPDIRLVRGEGLCGAMAGTCGVILVSGCAGRACVEGGATTAGAAESAAAPPATRRRRALAPASSDSFLATMARYAWMWCGWIMVSAGVRFHVHAVHAHIHRGSNPPNSL